jgi:hypothetical protein
VKPATEKEGQLPGASVLAGGCRLTGQAPSGTDNLVISVAALSARSCLIDGEAIVTDHKGLAVFDLIRGHRASTIRALPRIRITIWRGGRCAPSAQ